MGRSFFKGIPIVVLLSIMSLSSARGVEHYDQDMQDAIYLAAWRMNTMMNNYVLKGVYAVLDAERRILKNGLVYSLELLLRDTDCYKRGDWTVNGCHILPNPPSLDVTCTASLYSLHENGQKQITSVDCGNKRFTLIVGSSGTDNEEDDKLKDVISWLIAAESKAPNSNVHVELLSVEKENEFGPTIAQVVVTNTICTKRSPLDENCTPTTQKKKCVVTVDLSSIPTKLLSYHCQAF